MHPAGLHSSAIIGIMTMAALFRRSRALCTCHRSFSTSSPKNISLQWEKNDPEALAEVLPAYPYGPTRWYKQSRLGLYGGQRIQFGNNVSEKFETKTRRSWHPNIFTRKLFSKALNRYVQVRVSARVLRTIDKLGGLDEYLLGEKEARIMQLGESGWWLRWAIMQTPAVKKRFAEERRRLGLPEQREEVEIITEAMQTPEDDAPSGEQTEVVAMDDAFQIEQNDELPPIKFRVGPGQHIMLTPDGWRRTRPAPSYFINKRKEKLTKSIFPDYVERRTEAFEAGLAERLQNGDLDLSLDERKELIKATKKALREELQKKVDELYNTRLEAKEARKAERRVIKEDKKATAKDTSDL